LIGAMQPLLIMAISVPLYGERPGRRDIAAAVVAIGGVAAVVIIGSGQPTWSGAGDLAAAAATFSWGGYFIASRRAQRVLTSTEFTTGSSFWTAVLNVPWALITAQSLAPPTSGEWLLIVFMAFGVGIFGSALMNWAIPHLELWLSSIMTLVIPIVAAFLAWWLLEEKLTIAQTVAMAVVLGALAVIVLGQSTKQTPAAVAAPAAVPAPAAAAVASMEAEPTPPSRTE
jgi:probable blue pigment (indigoidine) exporter